MSTRTTPYRAGERYAITEVLGWWVEGLNTRPTWLPVMGALHDDVEHFDFQYLHYHVDPRFIDDRRAQRGWQRSATMDDNEHPCYRFVLTHFAPARRGKWCMAMRGKQTIVFERRTSLVSGYRERAWGIARLRTRSSADGTLGAAPMGQPHRRAATRAKFPAIAPQPLSLSAARRAAHLSTATRSTSYVRTSPRREYTMTRGPACVASGPCRSSVSGMQASDATSSGTGRRPSKTSTRAARCYLTCATGTATPCCSRWTTSRSQPRPWRQSRPASPRWKAHSRNAPARIRRRTCSCVPTTRHDRMVIRRSSAGYRWTPGRSGSRPTRRRGSTRCANGSRRPAALASDTAREHMDPLAGAQQECRVTLASPDAGLTRTGGVGSGVQGAPLRRLARPATAGAEPQDTARVRANRRRPG